MRKIPLISWKEFDKEAKEVVSDSAFLIKVLVGSRDAQKMPKGIDLFRSYNRIGKACEEAAKTGFIELEEADYSIVKKALEEDIPATWGYLDDVMKAVEAILNAELVKKE